MRGLLVTGIVVMTVVAPYAFLPVALTAYLGYRAVMNERKKLLEGEPVGDSRAARRAREELKREAARAAAVEYDKKTAFDLTRLPLDMKADLRTLRKDGRAVTMDFECAGIPGLVHARGEGKDVTYSFGVNDLEVAKKIEEQVRYYNGLASIAPGRDGSYVVTASNAAAINKLARFAFPPKEVEVSQGTRVVRQYVVEGCSTFEEAKAKLVVMKEADPGLRPNRTLVEGTTTVDGKEEVERSGKLYEKGDYIPVGAFVVNEVEESVAKTKVQVRGDLRDSEQVLHFAGKAADFSGVDPQRSESVSDGMPEGAVRYFDNEGEIVALHRADEVPGGSVKAYLVCDSLDSLKAVLENPDAKLPEGSFLALGTPPEPSVGEGPDKFVVSLDADSELLSRLQVQSGASPSLLSKCESMGVSGEDLNRSLIMEEIRKDGYSSVRAVKGLSLDRARINGVPLEDVVDRLRSDRYGTLDEDDLRRWLSDAGQIRAVNVTVDVKKREVRVTTVMADKVVTDRKELDEKQILELAKRGKISKADMRDLAMSMHPEFFKVYSVGLNPVYPKPLEDFIAGRRPISNKDIVRQMEEAKEQQRSMRRGMRNGINPLS